MDTILLQLMKIFLSDLRHKVAYLQSIVMEEEKAPWQCLGAGYRLEGVIDAPGYVEGPGTIAKAVRGLLEGDKKRVTANTVTP
jgi:hypothetical protein